MGVCGRLSSSKTCETRFACFSVKKNHSLELTNSTSSEDIEATCVSRKLSLPILCSLWILLSPQAQSGSSSGSQDASQRSENYISAVVVEASEQNMSDSLPGQVWHCALCVNSSVANSFNI